MLESVELNIADLWDICQKFLYTNELHSGISEFLEKNNAKKVLDCACGTGNPSIALSKKGFDVVCSDGSDKMLAKFQENCQKENINIPFIKAYWVDLSKAFNEKFDTVLCRGNSLIYANSWDKPFTEFSNAKELIKASLKAMYEVLNSGGFLYVDIFSKDEKQGFHDLGFRDINGQKTCLCWQVIYDSTSNLRFVRSWRTIVSQKESTQVFNFNYYSYFLPHSELVQMLKEVGFSRVDSYVPINGETYYDVFIAWKLPLRVVSEKED